MRQETRARWVTGVAAGQMRQETQARLVTDTAVKRCPESAVAVSWGVHNNVCSDRQRTATYQLLCRSGPVPYVLHEHQLGPC